MQLTELMEGVPRDRTNLVRDYLASSDRVEPTLARLADLPYRRLLDFTELAEVLGHGAVNPLDQAVTPRGYRALAHVPRLTDDIVKAVVEAFGGLDQLVRAPLRELEALDGVGPAQAREIREGLRRLQEHNLMDRYLQL
jgi:diadenylate cyclase